MVNSPFGVQDRSAIRVLHICPPQALLVSQYVSLTSDALAPYNIICISTDDIKEAGRLVSENAPHIVHLHGSVSPSLPSGCRVVVTPHGMSTHAERAYVAIARSEIERKRIEKQYPRTEVILNPVITRSVTVAETAKELCRVYRTVMDSNVLELMDSDTLTALRLLLKVGTAGDKRWAQQPLPATADWRQIVIYAYREGVLDTVKKGFRLFGAETPSINLEETAAYLPKDYETPKPPHAGSLAELVQLLDDEAAAGHLTLQSIVELQRMLMNTNVDEDKLAKMLEESKQTKMFGRLLHLAAEMTLLDEGFMPLPPINDKQTQQLGQTIKTRQMI